MTDLKARHSTNKQNLADILKGRTAKRIILFDFGTNPSIFYAKINIIPKNGQVGLKSDRGERTLVEIQRACMDEPKIGYNCF